MRTRTLYSWETRRYSVDVTAAADPTGDTVEFGVIDADTADADPASWDAGSWNGTWDSSTLVAEAYSPTFGTSESTATPDVTLTEGTTYRVFCRARNASDAPGALVAVLKVV